MLNLTRSKQSKHIHMVYISNSCQQAYLPLNWSPYKKHLKNMAEIRDCKVLNDAHTNYALLFLFTCKSSAKKYKFTLNIIVVKKEKIYNV